MLGSFYYLNSSLPYEKVYFNAFSYLSNAFWARD